MIASLVQMFLDLGLTCVVSEFSLAISAKTSCGTMIKLQHFGLDVALINVGVSDYNQCFILFHRHSKNVIKRRLDVFKNAKKYLSRWQLSLVRVSIGNNAAIFLLNIFIAFVQQHTTTG